MRMLPPLKSFGLANRVGLKILLVSTALALGLACRDSARAKAHVDKGNQYLERNLFTEAANEYQEAVRIAPDFAEAHYRLGLVEVQREHPAAAMKSFSRAVDLDPRNQDARVRLGNLLVASTQYSEAREQAEAVLRENRLSAAGHHLLGQVALHQMQYIEAENELRRAIELAPRDPQAYADLGLTQLLDAEYGAAEKSFQTAVEIMPDDPQTFINLSNFYKGRDERDRAEHVLREGMTRNATATELAIALASLYVENAHWQDAKPILDKLETDQHDFPSGRRGVAEFFLAQGDATAALDRFRALVTTNDHDLSAAKKVAECYLQLSRWQDANDWIEQRDSGQRDLDFQLLRARSDLGALRLQDARSELQKLLRDSPDVPALYYYLAQVYVRQEETGQAQQAFAQALRVQPGYVPALLGLANISLQQNDSDGALRYASQVIATSFWLADAHAAAGSAYLIRGDADQAKRAFELAAGLNARNPEIQERLGRVYTDQKAYSEAEQAYERSLTLAPDYAPALNGLADLLVKEGNPTQAVTRLGRQIALRRNSYQLQVAKAEFCISRTDWSCAERSYAEALRLNPYYINGYLALAHIYAATGRSDATIREYEAARGKFPEYLPTYILLSQVYEYLGNPDRAEQICREALKIDPNFYLALSNLARLYVEHGGPLADALELAQRAKSQQPEDPNVNDTLGWTYYKQGMYHLAAPVLEAAVAKSPQVAKFQFHLGLVYVAVGQTDQARSSLQTALNLGLSADQARSAQEALRKIGP